MPALPPGKTSPRRSPLSPGRPHLPAPPSPQHRAYLVLSGEIPSQGALPLPTPQPDERDEALRVAKEAVQAKITKAQIQCDKHAPMGGIKYLSWFGRLAGLKDALASIAAAKSKGGEG